MIVRGARIEDSAGLLERDRTGFVARMVRRGGILAKQWSYGRSSSRNDAEGGFKTIVIRTGQIVQRKRELVAALTLPTRTG